MIWFILGFYTQDFFRPPNFLTGLVLPIGVDCGVMNQVVFRLFKRWSRMMRPSYNSPVSGHLSWPHQMSAVLHQRAAVAPGHNLCRFSKESCSVLRAIWIHLCLSLENCGWNKHLPITYEITSLITEVFSLGIMEQSRVKKKKRYLTVQTLVFPPLTLL